MKKTWLVAYSLTVILILYIIGQLLPTSYFTSLWVKLFLFLLIPMALQHFYLGSPIAVRIDKKALILMLVTTAGIVAVILLSYIFLEPYIDVNTIKTHFGQRQKIDTANFMFPILYTIFINAFVEEYFFRGFLFSNMKDRPIFASVLSATLFAVYHMSIIGCWFSLPLMATALLGLFLGGMIFCWFMYKTKGLLGPYLVHMASDIAIVLVGLLGMNLFG